MAEAPKVNPEQRMLVDGKLVESSSGATFTNVNPATEEALEADNSMTIAQEEIFGPVLVVIPFDDDDDAVRIANDSVYGLAGTVFSGSLDRSRAVAKRVRAGTLSINGGAGYGADLPFGGYKHSGIGRQNGNAGFDMYLETKSMAWPAEPQ